MPDKNLGAFVVEYVTFDVTSLTNANNEPLSSWTDQSSIDDVKAAAVVGHDQASTYTAAVDHSQPAVVFETISDGSDPTSGVDVGEVKLRLEGRR